MTDKMSNLRKIEKAAKASQANAFSTHLILPNHIQSPPTTRRLECSEFDGNFY